MPDDLEAFLREIAPGPFVWGEDDCLMLLANWIRVKRGIDPAGKWRGSYKTRKGALGILKRRGGIVAHLDAILLPLGIERTEEPKAGDIAVVDMPEGPMGAIVTGRSVVLRGDQALILRPHPKFIAAWSV